MSNDTHKGYVSPHDEVLKAAEHWWEQHRPLTYGIEEHLENPTVNCATFSDRELGRAVAKYVTFKRETLKGLCPTGDLTIYNNL